VDVALGRRDGQQLPVLAPLDVVLQARDKLARSGEKKVCANTVQRFGLM
jgi:hypothetical protein